MSINITLNPSCGPLTSSAALLDSFIKEPISLQSRGRNLVFGPEFLFCSLRFFCTTVLSIPYVSLAIFPRHLVVSPPAHPTSSAKSSERTKFSTAAR